MLFLVLELLFYFIVGYGVVSLFGRIKGLQSEKKTKEVED